MCNPRYLATRAWLKNHRRMLHHIMALTPRNLRQADSQRDCIPESESDEAVFAAEECRALVEQAVAALDRQKRKLETLGDDGISYMEDGSTYQLDAMARQWNLDLIADEKKAAAKPHKWIDGISYCCRNG